MSCKLIHIGSATVEYSISGAGRPVLVLHGGHSNCREKLCQKGIDLKRSKLIIPSRPGYGHTTLTRYENPGAAAELMILLLDALGIAEVAVYGISAGGPTAIELAGKYPQRVKKLILASAVTKPWLQTHDPIYRAGKILFHPWVEKHTWSMINGLAKLSPRLIAQSFLTQFSTKPGVQLDQTSLRELLATLQAYRSGRGFINDLDQRIEREALAKVSCATLIIHSRNDRSVGFEHAVHARQSIRRAELRAVDNDWGHLLWLGVDADDAVRAIARFVEA